MGAFSSVQNECKRNSHSKVMLLLSLYFFNFSLKIEAGSLFVESWNSWILNWFWLLVVFDMSGFTRLVLTKKTTLWAYKEKKNHFTSNNNSKPTQLNILAALCSRKSYKRFRLHPTFTSTNYHFSIISTLYTRIYCTKKMASSLYVFQQMILKVL